MRSPCVARCGLNDDDICVGCFRHIDEIVGWGQASEARQQAIIEAVNQRKALLKQSKPSQASAQNKGQVISRDKWRQAEQRLLEQDS